MKLKLTTLAVASAFTGSALAADVNISGSQEFNYQNANGATTTELDGVVSIKATTELSNGWTATADFNIDEEAGNDGSNSLTLAGPFGTLDMGDTSSATDAIDDVTDWGYAQTTGTDNVDHAVLFTLPQVVDGLNIHVSAAADTNVDSNAGGSAVSAQYDLGFAKVGYGMLDNDDNTEATLMNATFSVAGVNLGYEVYTVTDASDVDTDDTAIGATYTTGPVTLGYENVTTESAGTTSADITAYGVHYAIANELTAFVESSEDDKTANSETTTVGVVYKF
jgi:hypothetical protein